ncbi:hypothetical protein MmiEs2_15220 [Methanimicrococcus stummii]|uniref:Uncharacterized protein n=1 Tax=Methanimicrococcus stummii TaxID=3028294 RepID=A0AA96VJ27_9EURY|nr:hypothetical protein [Methanimicrococcus sp. Es2]WNY29296.1 hypothetical protein MmiEs2_15220 [Methanimicrococcus sp. Es2]
MKYSNIAPPEELQDFYNKALFYAAAAHNGQFYAGNLPYIMHVCMVAAEVLAADRVEPLSNIKTAVQIALLHDVLEDTPITKEEMLEHFDSKVVSGVDLLTKKDDQPLLKYLNEIRAGGSDIATIKMCDRIINLQKPPVHWGAEKIAEYYEESILILEICEGGSKYVSERLKRKIELYEEMFMKNGN